MKLIMVPKADPAETNSKMFKSSSYFRRTFPGLWGPIGSHFLSITIYTVFIAIYIDMRPIAIWW